jgi:glycine cleavage system H protein
VLRQAALGARAADDELPAWVRAGRYRPKGGSEETRRVGIGQVLIDVGAFFDVDDYPGLAQHAQRDYTQQSSGDVAFVSLPEPGQSVLAGRELATVETIKVDLEVQAPFDGEIVAVNQTLEDAPDLINQDPYGRGWLVEVRPAQWPAPGLLDAEQYLVVMTAQAEAEAAQ